MWCTSRAGRCSTLLTGLVAVIGFVLVSSPAAADHGDISVPIDTVVEAAEGEVVQLASVSVEPELVGATCDWEFHATNQESVNPGNDLILSTGGTDTVIAGVEDTPDQILDVAGTVTLGETLAVSVRVGPNGVFSAGLSVEVLCPGGSEPSTTSTTAVPTTTTIEPETANTAAPDETTTTAPSSTTDVPASTAPETEVGGEVETVPALAATGPSSNPVPLISLAVLMVLGGLVLLTLRPRFRS